MRQIREWDHQDWIGQVLQEGCQTSNFIFQIHGEDVE